jgi:hypothetical protein
MHSEVPAGPKRTAVTAPGAVEIADVLEPSRFQKSNRRKHLKIVRERELSWVASILRLNRQRVGTINPRQPELQRGPIVLDPGPNDRRNLGPNGRVILRRTCGIFGGIRLSE